MLYLVEFRHQGGQNQPSVLLHDEGRWHEGAGRLGAAGPVEVGAADGVEQVAVAGRVDVGVLGPRKQT